MIQEAMGRSLRLLNRVAISPLAERFGLDDLARRAVYQGTRTGMRAANEAVSRFKQLKKLSQPERLGPASGGSDCFDLRPDEEQAMMQDTVRRFADDRLRPAAPAADEASAPPADILEEAHELGVALLAVPEALGGFGQARSPVTLALVAEALAHGDMGLATAILAPVGAIHALVDWGTAEQQGRYVAALTEGGFRPATLALVEPRAAFDPTTLRTTLRKADGGWRLDGAKALVPLGDTCELWLVAADVEGHGPRLVIVERDTPGVSVKATPAMGLRSAGLSELRFEDVRLPEDAILGGVDGDYDHAELVARGRVAWAALVAGAGRAVLDYVIPYCNERIAFGEPISHRQSVAFLIADIAVELEGLRLVMLRAASRLERGLDATREAHLARVLAADVGMKIGTDGVQLLGGHGFVKDHPVELWYRHLRAAGVMEGGLLV